MLMFRVADLDVKELHLADGRGVYFTTPHFDGYPAVLVRLEEIDLDLLREIVTDAWLLRAPKRLAQEWLAAHPPARNARSTDVTSGVSPSSNM